MTLGARPPSITPMFSVLGPMPSTGQFKLEHVLERCDQLVDRAIAQLGISGVRHLASGANLARSAPLEASASRLSVGSPLMRKRLPSAQDLPASRRLSRALRRIRITVLRGFPRRAALSAAAVCAAMMPLASQEPAAVDVLRILAESYVGWHGVDVRGKYKVRRLAIAPCIDIRALPMEFALRGLRDGSFLHVKFSFSQKLGKECRHRTFVVGSRSISTSCFVKRMGSRFISFQNT